MNRQLSPTRREDEIGFALLELMIALGIGAFLLAGIAAVMAVTRQTYGAQAGMGQLQDDQRIAVNVLVGVIEHAGYYYNPQKKTAYDYFPVTAPYANAGQTISGTSGLGNEPDTISVRYVQSPPGTSTSDFMEDCNGVINLVSSVSVPTNTFTIDSQNQLTCAVGSSTPKALAGGISSFNAMYGVDVDNDKSVDFYLPASSMTAAYWSSVGSVQVNLVFINRLDITKPISVKAVINLMNRA